MKISFLRTFYLFLAISFILQPAFAEAESEIINVVFSSESPPTSYLKDGVPEGIFIEYLKLVFNKLPKYKVKFHSMPWKRAQLEMQNGNMDLFLTCPTEERKSYAEFVKQNLYSWDYANIVFSKTNPKKDIILKAKNFEDLKSLLFLSQEGVSWENENIPKFIERRYVNKIETMIQLLLGRETGDFIVMGQDQAHYFAQKLGHLENLQMRKVSFIENSQIKFHIGIRKSLKNHKKLISDIEKVLKSPRFQETKAALNKKHLMDIAKLH